MGGAELMATLCDDFSKANNQSVVFEGRFPKYDNEIAIAAKYAKESGLKVGDEIEITANGKQEKYLICGFTQISNNLGRDCLFTRKGYERLGTLKYTSYYLNLLEGTDIDAFNSEMKEIYEGKVNSAINIQADGLWYPEISRIYDGPTDPADCYIIYACCYVICHSRTDTEQSDHQPINCIVFKWHRNCKMHIYSAGWIDCGCWRRTCAVCFCNSMHFVFKNKENCTESIAFRRIKRVIGDLAKSSLQQFHSQYSGRDPIIWCKV